MGSLKCAIMVNGMSYSSIRCVIIVQFQWDHRAMMNFCRVRLSVCQYGAKLNRVCCRREPRVIMLPVSEPATGVQYKNVEE